MNNSNLTIYVQKLISDYGLNIKSKMSINCLCECIQNIVFNIISISAIIAFINNSKTITKDNIQILHSYLNKVCSPEIKGGNSIVMPQEFYGINTGRYLPTNNQNDVLNINFSSGIMRQQIGGGKSTSPFIKVIKDFLIHYKLKAGKVIIGEIVKMIENYIKCLMMKLKKYKEDIKPKMIKNIIEKNKMFKIFK
jgi:histone H3/H4